MNKKINVFSNFKWKFHEKKPCVSSSLTRVKSFINLKLVREERFQ